MDIGFLDSGAPEAVLERARRLGFDGVELRFGSGGPCDLERWTGDDTSRLKDAVTASGVRVLSVGSFGPHHISPDPAARDRAAADMARALEVAGQLGAVVTCMAFGDPGLAPEDQVDAFGRVFGEYARRAEDLGVRIGIENWPNVHRGPGGIRIANLAHSPAMFARLFEAVPSLAVGLEFDPSHLYWQGADAVQSIRDFPERLVIVHAKDTEVFQEKLGRVGIYGKGWWTYRLPGLGQLDWDAIARALVEVGYDGGVVVEHEDPIFSGERFEEGLLVALKFLRQVLKQ